MKRKKVKLKAKLIKKPLIVKKSKLHGYGVFANKKFRKNEVIEECYFILSRGGDKKLADFYFDADGKNALLLGFGSIYNHADKPNADYKIQVSKRLATISAERTIEKGEEIFVSYGKEWFTSRGIKPKHSEQNDKLIKKR